MLIRLVARVGCLELKTCRNSAGQVIDERPDIGRADFTVARTESEWR